MFVDFHNHIDFFSEDKIKDALNDINSNQIYNVACAMDLTSYNNTLEISKDNKYIIPTFGVHPINAHKNVDNLDSFDSLIKNAPLVGEIGLDFCWIEDKSTYEPQIKVFEYFLKKSYEYNKFINIHTKGAEDMIVSLLKKYDMSEKAIVHWYSGDINNLKSLIDMNAYFTFSVDLNHNDLTKEILKLVPNDKILAETDGPTALEWVNGMYGMPSEIINVYKNISNIKKIDYNIISENSLRILNQCDISVK